MKSQAKSMYKTDWNFKLLYQSETDPQIEKDIVKAEKIMSTFEKKWKSSTFFYTKKSELKKALLDYETLIELVEFSKPYIYFYLRQDIDSNNKKVTAEISRIQLRLTNAQNKTIFFSLKLGKISKELQKEILNDSSFKKYHYFLEQIWKTAKYDLAEGEEKILNLMYEPASAMWSRGFDKVLSNQKVTFKNKDLTISEALEMVFELQTEDRIELQKKISAVFKEISSFAESEINAIYTKKKIEDELRGYKNPYDETLLRYQNDEKTVMNLVTTVTDNFKISQRFYKLKAKILGLKKLDYAARGISMGEIKKKFDFETGCEILLSCFEKVDPKYKIMFETCLKDGRVDAFPKKGKTGGAYCLSDVGIPTFVLHNYIDSYKSVNTFAHEMGHAFHAELSKSQPAIYEGHTMSVAETASTLFENFAFDEVFETLSEDEKIIALHDKINSSISTIFRQIACFNFEKELHEVIRTKGFASKEEIAELMNKHMKAYLGPIFDLMSDDGYYFVNWGHIRRFFYVYSYAYGELISSALYSEYKKDKSFLVKIEEFLSAGGSKSPFQIFKDIGIDTSKPDFFLNALKKIDDEITVLEKLVSKRKK